MSTGYVERTLKEAWTIGNEEGSKILCHVEYFDVIEDGYSGVLRQGLDRAPFCVTYSSDYRTAPLPIIFRESQRELLRDSGANDDGEVNPPENPIEMDAYLVEGGGIKILHVRAIRYKMFGHSYRIDGL